MKKTRKKISKFLSKIFVTNSHHELWVASSIVLLAVFAVTAFYAYQPDFQHSVNTLLWGTQQTTATSPGLFTLPVTVVYDSSSADQKSKMDQFLAGMVNPQQALQSTVLQTQWYDYHSPQAQALMAKSGLKYLPQIYIDPVIQTHPQFKAMSTYLNNQNGLYFIRLASLENLAVPPANGAHFQGADPVKAKVILQDYETYSSDQSAALDQTLQKILKDFPQNVSIVYKHFEPGDINNLIAQAAECASDQNKFFEMRSSIYKGQAAMIQKLNGLINTADPSSSQKIISYLNDMLDGYAQNLHLDSKSFQTCMTNVTYQKSIEAETLDALNYGISTAPTLIIDQQMENTVPDYDNLKSLIQAELAK